MHFCKSKIVLKSRRWEAAGVGGARKVNSRRLPWTAVFLDLFLHELDARESDIQMYGHGDVARQSLGT